MSLLLNNTLHTTTNMFSSIILHKYTQRGRSRGPRTETAPGRGVGKYAAPTASTRSTPTATPRADAGNDARRSRCPKCGQNRHSSSPQPRHDANLGISIHFLHRENYFRFSKSTSCLSPDLRNDVHHRPTTTGLVTEASKSIYGHFRAIFTTSGGKMGADTASDAHTDHKFRLPAHSFP